MVTSSMAGMLKAELDAINQIMAGLFNELGKAGFYASLLRLLCWQVQCDSVVILLYRLGDKPRILYDGMDSQDRDALLERYFEGAYLLSPFYLHWQAGQGENELQRLTEITPEGFFDSIYYTHYYARSGLTDEIGYIVPLDQDSALLISVGRTGHSLPFSVAEMQYFASLKPSIVAAIKQHLSLSSLPPRKHMQRWLEDGLRLFGHSVLTEREQEVLQLMLRGHSSKSCARLLGISPTTERVHRRNIYTKLDISSQSELFVLFFDAMSADSPPLADDPLVRPTSTI